MPVEHIDEAAVERACVDLVAEPALDFRYVTAVDPAGGSDRPPRLVVWVRVPGPLPNLPGLHPALLPLYPGLNTHQRAIDAGDEWHGSRAGWIFRMRPA